MLDQVDVDRLTRDPDGQGHAARPEPMSFVYCSECGFQNPEIPNYCARCGALLAKGEAVSETTQSFSPEDLAEHLDQEDFGLEGPALVVRAGGGRAGESSSPRRADAHRPLAGLRDLPRRRDGLPQPCGARSNATARFTVEDQGSLNGTFVNRRRIDSAQLAEGDELQIGKYRMTFIA